MINILIKLRLYSRSLQIVDLQVRMAQLPGRTKVRPPWATAHGNKNISCFYSGIVSDGAPAEGGGQNVHHHAQTASMGPTCTAVQKTGLVYQKMMRVVENRLVNWGQKSPYIEGMFRCLCSERILSSTLTTE